MTAEEFDKEYSRSMFPNDLAYQITKDSFIKAQSHIGCPYFIGIEFTVDGMLHCDGICSKHHKAIHYSSHGGCLENSYNN